jgi:hypothetical protein
VRLTDFASLNHFPFARDTPGPAASLRFESNRLLRQLGLTFSVESTIALRDPFIGLAALERAKQWQTSY